MSDQTKANQAKRSRATVKSLEAKIEQLTALVAELATTKGKEKGKEPQTQLVVDIEQYVDNKGRSHVGIARLAFNRKPGQQVLELLPLIGGRFNFRRGEEGFWTCPFWLAHYLTAKDVADVKLGHSYEVRPQITRNDLIPSN